MDVCGVFFLSEFNLLLEARRCRINILHFHFCLATKIISLTVDGAERKKATVLFWKSHWRSVSIYDVFESEFIVWFKLGSCIEGGFLNGVLFILWVWQFFISILNVSTINNQFFPPLKCATANDKNVSSSI